MRATRHWQAVMLAIIFARQVLDELERSDRLAELQKRSWAYLSAVPRRRPSGTPVASHATR